MINIKYDPYFEKGDKLSEDLKKLISNKDRYFHFFDSKFIISKVESPFILADNIFDIEGANNTTIEIGVKKTKMVSFTGGACYIEYVKDAVESVIVHGNEEEGYNVFILS